MKCCFFGEKLKQFYGFFLFSVDFFLGLIIKNRWISLYVFMRKSLISGAKLFYGSHLLHIFEKSSFLIENLVFRLKKLVFRSKNLDFCLQDESLY